MRAEASKRMNPWERDQERKAETRVSHERITP
jgi:hypothetical protein